MIGNYPQESYENTDQFRVSGSGFPIYPPLSEPANVTDMKTSADIRCKSSMSYIRDDPEPEQVSSSASDAFRSLLVGQASDGLGGDLLKKLEEAISRGDHKYEYHDC